MPENHNRRRLLTGSAALRTIAFALFGYLVSYQVAKAEGTAQVMPSANNGTALFMQPATSSGPLFGAAAENRLYFRIADHTVEDLYFGLACYSRSTPSSGKATNGFYRIFDPTGALVAGPTAIPSTGTGFINSYTEAVAGPNVSGLNPTGYAPLSFDPTMNGEYYIEIYRSNTAGATLLTGTAGEMYSVFFDFTVSESNFSTKPGRVHCQKWSFITYDPLTVNFPVSINFSFEGDYYGYTADSSLIKVDFPNGFRPLGYVLAMNNYGVTNTGNFATDRVSVYTGTTSPAFLAGYPVFLQAPDPLMYARSAAATGPVIGATVTGCPGSYTIPFSIDKPGDVTILIDLNGTVGYQAGTTDVVFDMFALSAGTHNLNWNGLDGLGSPVVGGTNVAISAVLFRGRTNLPVYDAELNSNGFSVDAVSPSASNRRLYWDDTGLAIFGVCPPGATVTQQGTNNTTNGGTRQLNSLIEGVSGFAHPWNGSNPPSSPPALPGGQGSATVEACDDFGNARTINTWFWAAEYPSAIANRILPNCVVNQPPVANDDNGPSLTEDGPNGTVNVITNDTDPDGNPTAPVNGVGQFTVDLDPGTVGIQTTFTDAQGVWTLNTTTGEVTFDPANNYNGTAVIPYTLCDPSGACDNANITFVVTPVNDPPVANDDNGPALTEDGPNGTVNVITNDTDPDGNPTAPVNGVGQFTVDLDPGTAGIQTTFTDAQGVWTLNTATGEVTFDPANNYNGTAVIPYTLCDPSGACDNANITFVVTPVNDPPVANDDNGPGLVENGPNGTVNIITNDTDPDGNPTAPVNGVGQFTVDLDPGTAGIQTTFTDAQGVWTLNTATGEVTFDPANNYNGTAIIPYTLCDPSGACDNANITFVVSPAAANPPVANDDNGPSLTEDGPNGTVNVISNDTDPDGNPTAPVNGVGQFTVDLDPGTVGIQTTFTDAQGVWTLNTTTGEVTFDPTTNYNGTAVIPYTLCDPSGSCDNANITFVVTPVNDPPVANDDNGPALTEDGPNGTVNVITNDTDPDGNPTAPVNGVGQFTVDLDPGTAGIQTTFTDAQGVWTLNTATGEVTFDPANNYNGTAVIPYTLCDPSGACDPANITFVVIPVNDPPVANDDNGPALTEDGPNGTVNVITNDTDPDGNPTAPVNGVGQFTVDLDPGTAGIQTTFTDAQGVWTLNTATGEVTFDPANNYNGTAVIPYTLCDPSGACDPANITFVVTPVNDPPVANDDNGPALTEDGPNGTVNVITNDTDPDGNPTAPVNGVGQFTVDLDPGTVGIQTTFTDAQGVWTLNTATGEVTFDPATNYNGTAVIPYTLCDPSGACDNANITFMVTPVNDPPVANDDNGPSLTEDGSNGTVNVITNDTDPDGNPTAPVNGVGQFTVDLDPGTVGIQTTFTDAQGVWTLNTATGEVTFDPANNYNGTAVIPYTLCDPSGACDNANITFVVTPVNDPPVANDDNGPSLTEDGPNGTVNVITNDTDPDGNPTAPVNGVGQFTVDLDPGTVGIQTTFTDAQGIWTLNTTTGEVTFDPANNYNGTAVIPYTLCDPSGACDNANITFVVTPVNDPPVANDDNGPALTEDGPNGTVNIITNDTDPDGNPTAPVNGVGQFTVDLDPGTVGIQTTLTDAQGVWTLNTATGEVTFDPANNYNGTAVIPYTLCDPSGACDNANITFVVTPVNDPPVANDDNGPALTEDGPNGTVIVITNDTDPDGNPTAPVNGIGQFTVDLDPGTVGIQTTYTDAQGVWTLNTATGEVTFDPATNYNGTAVIPYTLCDPSGACDPANITFVVTPVNDPPVANDDSVSIIEDDPGIGILVQINDTDDDLPLDSIVTTAISVNPVNGTATITPNGDIHYVPNGDFAGLDSLQYVLCDTAGPACDTAWVYILVSPVNDPPVATNDSVTINEDNPGVVIVVIANDTDADLPNDSLIVSGIITPPGNGTATILPSGDIQYTPTGGWSGIDSLQYVVCDTAGPVCDTAWVFITVNPVNDAPVVLDDHDTTTINTPVVIDPLGNDGDPNDLGGSLDSTSVTILTPPANGTANVDPQTGQITYTPATGFCGIDSLQYEVCDTGTPLPALCGSAWVFITVTCPNDPPVAVNDSGSVPQGSPTGVDIQVLSNDSDPNGDLITVTAIPCQPANGSATVIGPGTINYIPNPGFSGLDSLCYVICDNGAPSQCDTAWVFIQVVPANQPPVANDDSTSTPTGTLVVIDVQGNDTDPNGNPLTTSLLCQPSNGAAWVADMDSIIYVPNSGFVGYDTLCYTVCDNGNPPLCDTAYVVIYVYGNNNPPVAMNDTIIIPTGTPGVIGVTFGDTDPDGDSLWVSAIPCAPSNGTATIVSGTTITYVPNTGFVGVDSFCYVICDNGVPSLCDTAWVYVTVTPGDVVIIPTGFSPNGDGDNDVFEVVGIDRFPNNEILVFNRWGNIVYQREGYLNEWNGIWDNNDQPLPDGTYFYVLDLGDGSKPRSGYIVMFR